MIFGRKKRAAEEPVDDEFVAEPAGEADDEAIGADEVDDLADDETVETPDPEQADPEQDDEDELEPVDDSLREDGPFDVTEVDLDADDVERFDFGSLVLTPFEGMQLQLQVDQETQAVQSALVMVEQSALELALFAAPARGSMVTETVAQMVTNTEEQGGSTDVGEGPFGPELRRVLPVTADDGQQGMHVSRTWLVQGPRWLLRGVVMGEAGLPEGAGETSELLEEFFRNVVVRRPETPMVPGDLVPMTLPDNLRPVAEG